MVTHTMYHLPSYLNAGDLVLEAVWNLRLLTCSAIPKHFRNMGKAHLGLAEAKIFCQLRTIQTNHLLGVSENTKLNGEIVPRPSVGRKASLRSVHLEDTLRVSFFSPVGQNCTTIKVGKGH